MDLEVIGNFSNKVNENEFVLFKYGDVEGKNKWNCVCSAMDWIRLSARVIDKITFDNKDIDINCMELYKYISCIDIILESIQQLHRVFFDDGSLQKFIDTDNIFKNKIGKESDNNYFKTIRASFGAHPVNLDEPNSPQDKGLKRFASNPFDNRRNLWKDGRDFSVRLYSNIVGEEDLPFPIWISELKEFIKSRYMYLNTISKQIDVIYEKFATENRKRVIVTSEEPLEQIEILKTEVKIRANNDYYTWILDDLKMAFTINSEDKQNQKILECYRQKLLDVIKDIKENLQNMIFTEIQSYEELEEIPDNVEVPSQFSYAIEKLSNAYYGGSEIHTQYPIEEFLEGIIDFTNLSLEERYVLTHAGICYKINS
ncbi:MAG: hypothetical protein FWC79_07525 [Oscillospiraceae bacterium]|nr:hypothetical protein [Oscillospiraceae bacterium]